MNFWNYKALAKSLSKDTVVKNEKVIYHILAIIFVLFNSFFSVVPLIGVLVWYTRAFQDEKEPTHILKTKEFLSVLSCLFVPVSIRNIVYGWCLLSLIYLLIILCGLKVVEGPFPLFYFSLLMMCFLSLFIIIPIYAYDMYRALRTFSYLSVKTLKSKENTAMKKENL